MTIKSGKYSSSKSIMSQPVLLNKRAYLHVMLVITGLDINGKRINNYTGTCLELPFSQKSEATFKKCNLHTKLA